MPSILITIALTLLSLGMAYYSFRRWRKTKRAWFLLSFLAAILAAISFWLSTANGFLLFIPAALLLVLGEIFHK